MLPPNLLVVSIVIFLTTTVSTAPLEEKEEAEATEEVEGELSEEEEDDDDSQSLDKTDEGAAGVQQTTMTAAAAPGGSAPGGQSAGGGTGDGTAGGSPAGRPGDSSSADSAGDLQDSSGHMTSAAGGQGSPAASQGSAGSPGSPSEVSAAQSQLAASDGVDSEPNGNGQKLLNGGGGEDGLTGVSGSFADGLPHLDYTDHMTQLDSTGTSSGVTAALSADQNGGPDPPAGTDLVHRPGHMGSTDPLTHSDISVDQSGPGHASPSSGQEQSPSSSISGSSHPAAHRDGADSPEANGNSRQTLLTDTLTGQLATGSDVSAVTDRLVSFTEVQTHLQTDLAGGAEPVTGLHIDLTASGLGLGHDVTESSPVVLHTESADRFTHTLQTGVYSYTDLVTMAADSTGTDTVPADPTGSPPDSISGHPAVTNHLQTAGSVTEQYNPSGQGPEGPENVELEDTC